MPNIRLTVQRGLTWTDATPVTAANLNLTGSVVVEIPEDVQIPASMLDIGSLLAAVGDSLRGKNYIRRPNFWPDEWFAPQGQVAPAAALTENAWDWYARPVGADVTVSRVEESPDEDGVFSAQITGATGCTQIDFGTWIPAGVAGQLRGEQLTFSLWVKQITGAQINCRLGLDCPDALDSFAGLQPALLQDNEPVDEAVWTRLEWTFQAPDATSFKYGAFLYVRTTALNAGTKTLLVRGAQLEVGSAASAFIRPQSPQIPKDGQIIWPDSATDVSAAPFDVVVQNRLTGDAFYLAPPPALFAKPYLGFNPATLRPQWMDFEGNRVVFHYTGTDQILTVPAGATSMTVHAWGAGGSNDAAADSGAVKGGVGAYARATFAVTAGTQYAVVVGEGAHGLARRAYGFGGAGQGLAHNHNGGGLTGLFTGTGTVLAGDFSRALVIAGGGGAAGQSGNSVNAAQGGNGNDGARSGGESTFQGIDASGGQTSGNGGGGGGRYGGSGLGLGGKGGTSFVHMSGDTNGGAHALGTSVLKSQAANPSLIVPEINLDGYVAPAGQSGRPGLLVVVFA